MRNSYVGIIGQHGLESLHVENEHTVAFLQRRIERRQRPDDICFWTVLDTRFAAVIEMEIANDGHAQALILLQTLADEIGRILPESLDSLSFVLAE